MKAHSALGNGFLEVIYQRALAIELDKAVLDYEREFSMNIYYDGVHIGTRRVDFLIEGKIMFEITAISKLANVHFCQARNYLEAYNQEIGLLINFGVISLEFRRLSNAKFRPGCVT